MGLRLLIGYWLALGLASMFCLVGVAAIFREVTGEAGESYELWVGLGCGAAGLGIFWLLGYNPLG